MLLSLAALTALLSTCAPDVAAKDLAAVAQTESRLDPLAVHDNTTKQSHSPADKDAAVELARQLLRAGHSVDLGLMQINDKNLGWVGLTLEASFEPCDSIRAGAQVLTAFSRYNTGTATRGFSNGYVARVVANRTGTPRDQAIPPAKRHEWHDAVDDDQDK